jgi:CheY-like chemotaxis protein
MRALCVGRHSFLSSHLCKYFSELSVETHPAVGLEQAAELSREHRPDAVISDYDLITPALLDRWGADPDLRVIPIIAVSLTRRPEEVYVQGGHAVAAFLYLPTLEREDALRLLSALSHPRSGVVAPAAGLAWPSRESARFR